MVAKAARLKPPPHAFAASAVVVVLVAAAILPSAPGPRTRRVGYGLAIARVDPRPGRVRISRGAGARRRRARRAAGRRASPSVDRSSSLPMSRSSRSAVLAPRRIVPGSRGSVSQRPVTSCRFQCRRAARCPEPRCLPRPDGRLPRARRTGRVRSERAGLELRTADPELAVTREAAIANRQLYLVEARLSIDPGQRFCTLEIRPLPSPWFGCGSLVAWLVPLNGSYPSPEPPADGIRVPNVSGVRDRSDAYFEAGFYLIDPSVSLDRCFLCGPPRGCRPPRPRPPACRAGRRGTPIGKSLRALDKEVAATTRAMLRACATSSTSRRRP